jgi:hypothetical protein
MSRRRALLVFAVGALVAFAAVPAAALLALSTVDTSPAVLALRLAPAIALPFALVAAAVRLAAGRHAARLLGARRTAMLAVPLAAAPVALLPPLAAGGPGRAGAALAALAFAPAWVLLLERTSVRSE